MTNLISNRQFEKLPVERVTTSFVQLNIKRARFAPGDTLRPHNEPLDKPCLHFYWNFQFEINKKALSLRAKFSYRLNDSKSTAVGYHV